MKLAPAPALAPLDDAQRFLSRVVPWDGESYVNIHWRFRGENYDRPGWYGTPCHTVDEALRAVYSQLRKPTSMDIYVCMSSQRLAHVVERNGRSWNAAVRLGPNAVQLKALFADIDVKEGAYSSTKEALTALRDLRNETGFPTPTVLVQTGSGGLHAYWVMEDALSPDEWLPLAHAFANLLMAKGIHCDLGCTTDLVRILRVPQTHNYKLDPPSPVELMYLNDADYPVERIRKALEGYAVRTPRQPLALPPRAPQPGEEANTEIGNELGQGVEPRAPIEFDLKAVVPQCPFLRNSVVSGGKDNNNPLWMLTTLIATFTTHGEHNAHVMASGHPTYSKEETDAMYARKLRDREDKGLGWPSCSTIHNSGSKVCAACPHLQAGKSPLHFALPKKGQPNVAPVPSGVGVVGGISGISLPTGYKQDKNGCIYKESFDDDGNPVHKYVAEFPILNAWAQGHPFILHFDTSSAALGRSQKQISMVDVPGDQAFGKVLNGMGIFLQESQIKPFRSFIVSWMSHLQNSKDTMVNSQAYGWGPEKGRPTSFTFAGKTYSKDGERRAAMGDAELASQFEPVGELQPWKDAAKFITDQGRQDLCALLATAFAAPLMRHTHVPGVIVSGYSRDSGIGKTTAMTTALSAWGHPKRALQGLSDTSKSVVYKMGQLRSLPVYWDELHSEQNTRNFIDIVFRISSGKEHSKLTRDSKLLQSGDWNTIMVVAANDSISEAVARKTATTTAGINRVFEFRVQKVPQTMVSAEANQWVGPIYENYGNAGVVYAKWLGEHTEEIRAEVSNSLIALQKDVAETTEERLWTAAMTTLLLGAKYANDLGLTEFDVTALREFLVGVLQDQRGEKVNTAVDMSDEFNISNVLSQFLKATAVQHTIRTNMIHTAAGKPKANSITVINDTTRLVSAQVQIGRDDNLLRFSKAFLSHWLEKNSKYNPYHVVKAAQEKLHMREFKGRIGSGTGWAASSEQVLELDMTTLRQLDILDD